MDWKRLLELEMQKQYYLEMVEKIDHDRTRYNVYPKKEDVFKAFQSVSFKDVKVVVLGQDPYHQENQAMGLSFSVPKECKLPKSLVNIFKELKEDLGIENKHGDLSAWAREGVLLLNTVLTVIESKPMSHAKIGWTNFTDSVLMELGRRKDPVVFVLWGKEAQKKKSLIQSHHYFIESSHPSPLGAYRGFIGSKPFSKINNILSNLGKEPIDWRNDV